MLKYYKKNEQTDKEKGKNSDKCEYVLTFTINISERGKKGIEMDIFISKEPFLSSVLIIISELSLKPSWKTLTCHCWPTV